MAKFRMNHSRSSRRAGGMHILRIALFFALILVLLFAIYRLKKQGESLAQQAEEPVSERFYLPKGDGTCQLIHHRFFSLCYDEDKEVPRWVAYSLTASSLRAKNVSRSNDYRPDTAIPTASADPYDYRRSGYDRGHLVAAADRAFSREAMSETFLMSNIAPQDHLFNSGIWRELEQNTRRWAKQKGKLYVIIGPIYSDKEPKRIGRNGVAVPDAFFRVLLNPREGAMEGTAFVIPNLVSDKPLSDYQMSIDSVESLTRLDFFDELLTDSLEEAVESRFSTSAWPLDERSYRTRVEKWNKEKRGK